MTVKPKENDIEVFNQTLERRRQGENLESSKKKLTCNIQGNLSKIVSGFFRRNLGGQKAVE